MSYWHDEDWQLHLLKASCRDRNFLKRMAGLLSAKDFEPRKGEPGQEIHWIAEKAFKYWRDYREPIGGMLKTEMLDYLRERKKKIGQKQRDRILDIVADIRHADGLVAVEAIERKVAEYKARQAKSRALRDAIDLQEKGELTDRKWREIFQGSLERVDHAIRVSNYEEEIDKRIRRREKHKNRRFPLLFIDPIDRTVRTFPRGELGCGLAKYGTGKSTLAVWLDQVYALQGHNVLHFTTEDPADVVEDRLDASFTGVRLKELAYKPDKVRRRLRRALQKLRGRIKVIDATDGGMTVGRMEEIWEQYRNRGFDSDTIIVDYDEGIEPTEHYKGDGGERRESMEIYRELKHFVSSRQLYGWVMAQTTRGKRGARQMIITGDDAAIDISKIKRTAFGIGIGDGPEEWGENGRYLYNFKHRYDTPKHGWPIMGNFKRGIFYDKEKTDEMQRLLNSGKSSVQ